ncbi:ribonuclease III family protein [[Eubacterium] cellulosolvens]
MELVEAGSILQDKDLAKLGDSYVNFVFSLALTEVEQHPTGIKVSDRVLAEAAKRSGLRKILPNRINKDILGNAVEALIIHAWINKSITIEESVNILKRSINDPSQAFTNLIIEVLERIDIK